MTDDALELERQFNPRVSVPDFQTYLDRNAGNSRRARERLRLHADIRYGPRPRQLLDVFEAGGPIPAGGAPVCIYVHGGFWRALGKEIASGLALPLSAGGIVTVAIGYDLCPQVTLDELVEEIRDAVVFVHDRIAAFGGDPARLVLAGNSAGAHLCAMVMADPPEAVPATSVRGAMLASGVYDLAPVLRISVNADIRLDAAGAARNSPSLRLPVWRPPIVVAVGDQETPAWIEQSVDYAARCREAGCEVELMRLEGAHHFSTGLAIPGSPACERLIRLCLG